MSARTPLPPPAPPNSEGGSLDERVTTRAVVVLERHSKRRGLGRALPFLGSAFGAPVAYMDPGNFATNIGGARFGYLLLWVVLGASLMAMLMQNLSSRLGIASGKNLPEHIRDQFSRRATWLYWAQAELVAMATDLAEFLGAALAFDLLFGVPLIWGAVLTGMATVGILALQKRGFRPIEVAITAFVGVIAFAYVVQLALSKPGPELLTGFIPRFQGAESLYLAVGIIGATVMPHVIYLHSALTQGRVPTRTAEQKKRLARFTFIDVALAMGVAALINMAMLASAAAAFHFGGKGEVADLSVAHRTLTPLLGPLAAVAFGLALLASLIIALNVYLLAQTLC